MRSWKQSGQSLQTTFPTATHRLCRTVTRPFLDSLHPHAGTAKYILPGGIDTSPRAKPSVSTQKRHVSAMTLKLPESAEVGKIFVRHHDTRMLVVSGRSSYCKIIIPCQSFYFNHWPGRPYTLTYLPTLQARVHTQRWIRSSTPLGSARPGLTNMTFQSSNR